MKAKLSLLLAVFTIIALIGCAHYQGACYRNDWGCGKLESIADNLAVIKTVGEIKNAEQLATKNAIAIPIGDGFVVALTHATKIPSEIIIETPEGLLSEQIEIISTKFFIGEEEIQLVGRKSDISLFKSKTKKKFPFSFGDSDELCVGDKAAVVGFSFVRSINAKDGIISHMKIGDEYGNDDYGNPIREICFMLTAPLNPGDSGSPVVAQRNGTLELVGIACAALQDRGMSFALKINYVKEMIEAIKKEASL